MRLALGIEHDLRFAPSSVGTLWEQSYRRLARMRKLRVLLDMRDIRFPGPSELATPLCLNSPFPLSPHVTQRGRCLFPIPTKSSRFGLSLGLGLKCPNPYSQTEKERGSGSAVW